MTDSERLTSTRAGIALCRLDDIADPGARNIVIEIGERRFFGFVVRRDDEVHGYVDRCPHQGLPLAQVLDDYLTPDGTLIACSWHGALFRPEDGVCVGGPVPGRAIDALAGDGGRRHGCHSGAVDRAGQGADRPGLLDIGDGHGPGT